MAKGDELHNDDELADAVRQFESQFKASADNEDKAAKARALLENEIVAITRKLCDLALYSDNPNLSYRAASFLYDQVMNPKNGNNPLTTAEQAMFEKMGLDK